MTTLDRLAPEKYVLLTTFRKDGRAVPTPVWIAPDGAGLAFTTPKDSGKVKRIRTGARVTLTPCDMRGKVAEGAETTEAYARMGSPADLGRVEKAVMKKYGLTARLIILGGRLRGRDRTLPVLITEPPAQP